VSDFKNPDSLTTKETKSELIEIYNNLAKSYYQKVLFLSKKNKEEKAFASLMIFECDYVSFATVTNFSGNEKVKFKPRNSVYNFNTIYSNAQNFKKYNCPLLQGFIKQLISEYKKSGTNDFAPLFNYLQLLFR
jgi:hypothetical protein